MKPEPMKPEDIAKQKLTQIGVMPDEALKIKAEDVDAGVPDILESGLEESLDDMSNASDALATTTAEAIDPDLQDPPPPADEDGEEPEPRFNQPIELVGAGYCSCETTKEVLADWTLAATGHVRSLGGEVGVAAAKIEEQRFALAENVCAGQTALTKERVDEVNAALDPLRAQAIGATHGFQAVARKLLTRQCAAHKEHLGFALDKSADVPSEVRASGREEVRAEKDAVALGETVRAAGDGDVQPAVDAYLQDLPTVGSNRRLGELKPTGEELDRILEEALAELDEAMDSLRERLEAKLARMQHAINSLDKNFTTAAGQMAAARRARFDHVGESDYAVQSAMLEAMRADIKGRISPEARERALQKKAEIRAQVNDPEKKGAFVLNDRGFWVAREDADTRFNLPSRQEEPEAADDDFEELEEVG